MATQTPNLGLTLPVGGENVSRQIINQNMTLIDQYCGAINQSTYRLVPFTLAVNDWVSSGGQWVVDFSTAYVTASSDEIITFGSSLANAQAHIIAEKRSGGGGVKFTTATKPTGAIQGMIRIFDNDDHKIPILVEGTVTPIANGGTGQSNLSGAQQALGITALSNQIATIDSNTISFWSTLTTQKYQGKYHAQVYGNFKGKTLTLTGATVYNGTSSYNILSTSEITKLNDFCVNFATTSDSIGGTLLFVTFSVS